MKRYLNYQICSLREHDPLKSLSAANSLRNEASQKLCEGIAKARREIPGRRAADVNLPQPHITLNVCSCRTRASQHGGDGSRQNLQIQPDRPLIDVLHVQLHPLFE